jgi:hypothetical protein
VSADRLPPIHHWNRISRDWFSEPRLVSACEQAGVAAAAGWQVLVARGALSQGWFADAEAVAHGVRCFDIGLGSVDATKVARSLIEVGLVVPDGTGYRIANWENYAPPRNAQAPSQRAVVTPITPQSRPDHTAAEPQPLPSVTEREKDGMDRKTGEREGLPDQPRQAVPITLSNGDEVMYLPPDPQPSESACSHGNHWVLRPAGAKDGRQWSAFWSGDHLLPNGKWCKDRKPMGER